MFTITCKCGKYDAEFEGEVLALTAANMHVMLGKDHIVTCTRPAHNHKGSIPVIVFTARQED
jgi:hypothetical protein